MAVSELNDSADDSTAPDATSVYVGPRPYRFGQELYGRDREAVDLTRLLISQRLVLLHSPSGAGKTSLIHAKIVPALQKRRFEIPFNNTSETARPQPITIRVNREPEESDPPGANRYKLSAMLSLELQRPEAERRGVNELSGMSLDDYLEEAFPAASRDVTDSESEDEIFRPLLLLFDQFEELVTMDPTDESAKREFVQDLGKALSNKGRWSLFAVREDFLGALEPYLPAIPTHLSATYRLDLLRAEMAATVIEEPARSANVTYGEGVVEDVVEDLRRIRVQQPDGSFQHRAGLYVEPVQLQVVCQSLWRIRGDSSVITHEHLEKLGRGRGTGVDAVLAGYYADRVAEAASEQDVSERLVRNWFSKSLIGSQHVRRPVLVDEALAYGLTLKCLQVLDKAFLIRRENRSGATWYELAHDRLMAPIIEDNLLWRKEHLTTFQTQAELWEDRSRPDSLLLSGETLDEAEREAEQLQAELTAYEKEFLDASQKAREHRRAEEARQQERSRVKRLKMAVAVGALMLVVVSSLAGYAVVQGNRAVREMQIAERAKQRAEQLEERANWLGYSGRIGLSLRYLEEDNPLLARELLTKTQPEFRGWEYGYLDARIRNIQNVFTGHQGSVTDVEFFADGQRIVSASVDSTLMIWDTATRQPQGEPLVGRDGAITCCALSKDEKWIVSGGDEDSLRLWDLRADPITSRKLEGRTTMVTCVAIDPESQWCVSGSQDSTLIKWDLVNHSQDRAIEAGHDGSVLCVAITPDGEQIVSGGVDGTLKIWTSDLKLIATLTGHKGPVMCVAVSPDGTWLASGGLDRNVLVWDLDSSRNREPLLVGRHEEAVSSLAIRHDGKRIASGSRDGVLTEWYAENVTSMFADRASRPARGSLSPISRTTMRFKAHAGVITSLDYGLVDQKSVIVSGGTNNMFKIWEGEPPDETPEFTGHTGPVWDLVFDPEGKWIVTASGDRTLQIQPIADENREALVLRGHTDEVWCVAVSPDGKYIASGGVDKTVRLWDADSGELIHTMTGHENEVTEVCFSPDPQDQSILSSSHDGRLKLWDANTGQERRSWKAHELPVTTCAISPDGQHIASGAADQKVIVWDPETGDKIRTLSGHNDIVWCVEFSPDGKLLVSGSRDGTLKIWDVATGTELGTLEGHTAWVTSVDFSPDGKRIVSGSGDNTIKIWQLVTRMPTLTLSDHGDTVWSVQFSNDGKTLASCSEDWTYRLWETSVKSKRETRGSESRSHTVE